MRKEKQPLASHLAYAAMIGLVTICCLAIEIMAPESWRPDIIWLMLTPASVLVFASGPVFLALRRARRSHIVAEERADLVGLLLKDYAAERCDWLWWSDGEGKLRGVTDKFLSHTDRKHDAIEGTRLTDFLRTSGSTDTRILSEIDIALRQRKPFFDIEINLMVRGEENWWRLAGKPVFRDGRFVGYVGTASDITADVVAKRTVSYLAYHDGLTGLANRSHFTKKLAESVAQLERHGTPFSLLYLDLDKFKAVNDSRGHHVGDRLLIEVGKRLTALLQSDDTFARLGGDEFAIVLPECIAPDAVSALAERMIEAVGNPYLIDGDALIIGLSIGVSIAPIHGTRPDQLLRNADLALYRAKADGGNRCCYFANHMDSEIRERRMLELELSEAIKNGEFELYYQPLVATADGTVAGFEALIRWNHPIRGLVPPGEFIPLAERSTLIGDIGEWTVFEACRMLTRLPERLTVAVNLSTKHFRIADMFALVKAALDATGIDPKRLELEITESLLVESPEEMAVKLRQLKSLGVKIAMDDFGTGFSSLSYLLRFPFDKIKIDRYFVTASSEDNAARQILSAIVNLACTLEMAVTAEGVETEEQVEFLKGTGCGLLQGYYFARPMPEGGLEPFMAKQRRSIDQQSAGTTQIDAA